MKIGTGFTILSHAISKLESLKQLKLELRYIQLSDSDIELFFTHLENLPSHLSHLSLQLLNCIEGMSTAESFSKGFGKLTHLISLGLDLIKDGYPMDWNSNFYIGIACLPKLNSFCTFEETSKSRKARLFKINKKLVNIKRC